MIEEVEREIRSIRRQFDALTNPPAETQLLAPESRPLVLRAGSSQSITFPHEGILDRILALATSVWHFKEYLKAANELQSAAVEAFAENSDGLKIVADLANTKKHARLDRPRSGLSPALGFMHDNNVMLDVVRFDTSKCGMFEFGYNGLNKTHHFRVTNPVPIPFDTEIIVTTPNGPASKGNAALFIHAAFGQWLTLLPSLGIQIRQECTE